MFFIPHRASVVACLVKPLAIVEALDVVEDRGSCLIALGEVTVPHAFVLQVAEEALCRIIGDVPRFTCSERAVLDNRKIMQIHSCPN